MNKDDTKQAIIGFMEFTKGITSNKDLKIPEDIAKEYGIEQDDTSDNLESEEISREEIAALLARGSGDAISRHDEDKIKLVSKQDVINLIDEWNAISFYEANEHSKECYYEIRNAIISMQPVASCLDTISRQEAIDAFSMFAEYESNRTHAEWVNRIRIVLSSLPPVQPIRQRCGDCKYYQNDSNGLYGECFYHSIDKLKPNGDWFCTDFEEEQA